MIASEHSHPALSRAPQARRSRLLLTAMEGCAIPLACKNICCRLVCCSSFCAVHSKIFLLCPLELYLQVCLFHWNVLMNLLLERSNKEASNARMANNCHPRACWGSIPKPLRSHDKSCGCAFSLHIHRKLAANFHSSML